MPKEEGTMNEHRLRTHNIQKKCGLKSGWKCE